MTRSSQPAEILLPSLHYSSCKAAATMKFVSFNINGLRAPSLINWQAIVEKHQPECDWLLQETKVHDDMFPLEEVAKLGYNVFYHGQKGHYGRGAAHERNANRGASWLPGRWRRSAASYHHGGNPIPSGQHYRDQRLFPRRAKAVTTKPNFRPRPRFNQNLQNYSGD